MVGTTSILKTRVTRTPKRMTVIYAVLRLVVLIRIHGIVKRYERKIIMGILLRMLLPEILALLQASVKNPSSLATEAKILTAIRDECNTILAGIQPGTSVNV